MPLAQNLIDGGNAIAFARTHIVGSSNKHSDRIRAQAGGIEAIIAGGTGNSNVLSNQVGASRQAIGATLVGAANVDTRSICDGAIASGVGNCHELAAVAYEWLRFNAVTPIDIMRFSAAGYDHVWVVIGRAAGSTMDNLRSWGSDAVWVDPWQGDDGVVFAVQDLVKGRVRNLNAIYKCNTCELVEAGAPSVITSA